MGGFLGTRKIFEDLCPSFYLAVFIIAKKGGGSMLNKEKEEYLDKSYKVLRGY
jgi:hypothetical protein